MHIFSLWLIPKGQEYKDFSRIIKVLAKKNSAPRFEPHVTLIGGILTNKKKAIKNTKQLASFIFPFSLTLTDIGYENTNHKALFINCGKSKSFLNAHRKAREIFKHKEKCLPHISLIYGIYDELSKKEMIKEIKKYPKNLRFDSIYLFNVEDKYEEKWYQVAEFKLTRG
jgi:2'-5' RNA ligase